ncbi:MAG: histidine kinase [Bacteroidota bacterium]
MMNQLKIYWDKTFTSWPYRLGLHISFWFFFLSSWLDESMVVKINATQHYLVTLIGTLFVLFLYYALVYIIIPLFKKKQWFLGILAFMGYYGIAVVLRTYHIELIIQWYNFHRTSIQGGEFWSNLFERQFNVTTLLRVLLSGFTSLIVIIYIPLSIKFLRYAYQFTQKQAWIIKENTQLQLNTLKAQINPHFLFNTLNNLQSFIVQNEKEKSVELLNRLADFMRTALYDGEKEYLSMEKEVELLTNYIRIERVRFEEDTAIRVNISTAYPNVQIPPFIFLPFIENTFKHGGAVPAHEVKIEIDLIHEAHQIILKTSNKFVKAENNENLGGIGLQNVKKRLDYYFPNGYQLDISILDQMFNVKLQLNK